MRTASSRRGRRCAAFIALLGWAACHSTPSPALPSLPAKGGDQKTEGRIAAQWNGGKITVGELEAQQRIENLPEKRLGVGSSDTGAKKLQLALLLQRMIEGRLLEAEAEAMGIRISEEQENAWLEAGMGDARMRKEALIDAMVFKEDFRRDVRIQMLREDMAEKLLEENPPAEGEFDAWKVDKSLDAPDSPQGKRCVYQIVVRDVTAAEEVRKRLKEGTAFEDLAREKGITPEASKGGFVGCFVRGELPEYLEETVFHAAEGEISEPIQSSYGYHFIYVPSSAKRPQETKEERQAALEKMWNNERKELLFNEWLREIMKKNNVRIFKENLQ